MEVIINIIYEKMLLRRRITGESREKKMVNKFVLTLEVKTGLVEVNPIVVRLSTRHEVQAKNRQFVVYKNVACTHRRIVTYSLLSEHVSEKRFCKND